MSYLPAGQQFNSAEAGSLSMKALDLVRLSPLLSRSRGKAEIIIGLIDGPVALQHPAFVGSALRPVPGAESGTCSQMDSFACQHGTMVAGVLSAQRGSGAPALCPDCSVLVRPIFAEAQTPNRFAASAAPGELAAAILDCIQAGAHVINLSLALSFPSLNGERALESVLDLAAQRGVILVAAAGNQGTLGSSPLTRHPWTVPVTACDLNGRPSTITNLARSIGRRGLAAPGEEIVSLNAQGGTLVFSGTSAATPFVTGTIALLLSEFPTATTTQVKLAVTQPTERRRNTLIPPLLDAWAAYQSLKQSMRG